MLYKNYIKIKYTNKECVSYISSDSKIQKIFDEHYKNADKHVKNWSEITTINLTQKYTHNILLDKNK